MDDLANGDAVNGRGQDPDLHGGLDGMATAAGIPFGLRNRQSGLASRKARRPNEITVRLSPEALGILRDTSERRADHSLEDLAAHILNRVCVEKLAAPVAATVAPEAGGAGMPRQDWQIFTAPFLLVSQRAARLDHVVGWIHARGSAVKLVSSLDEAVADVRAKRWTSIVVDADSVGDLPMVVDTLVRLREERPHLPLILVSGRVSRDDFDLERLPLCDVTLRHPVEADNFGFAVQEAMINNRVWIARRRALHLMHATPSADGMVQG